MYYILWIIKQHVLQIKSADHLAAALIKLEMITRGGNVKTWEDVKILKYGD